MFSWKAEAAAVSDIIHTEVHPTAAEALREAIHIHVGVGA